MSSFATTRLAGTVAVCLTAATLPFTAQATEGYFALGFGPVQRGAGGAGVANVTDAMGAALNPASVATLGRELDYGAQLFSPKRGFTGQSTAFVPSEEVRSGMNLFLVPNFAYNMPLASGGVLNISAYGNGGMNTSYKDVANSNCPAPPDSAGFGVFCGGDAGVDLTQLFVSATYAKKVGAVSFGISPTVAVQRFGADGIGAFQGFSIDPGNFTNRGYDFSTGAGVRGGVQIELSPSVTFGVSGQTKFNMSPFDKYSGLYAGGGDFDIPASVTAGLAFSPSSNLKLLLDYQKIYYSGIDSIANSLFVPAYFGMDGGPGFGWEDVNVVKLGVEWQSPSGMVWRAGYAQSSNPVGAEDAMLNILAPGIVKDHYTFGGSKPLNANTTFDFSVNLVASNTVTGPEFGPDGEGGLAATGGMIKLEMHQASVSVGLRKTF